MTNVLTRFFSTKYMVKERDRLGDIPTSKEGYKRAINMAWPSIVEAVLMAMVNLVDTLMVSGLGEEAVAAVGIVGQPRMIVLSLIFSLNSGVIAVVARRKGQGDRDGANRCLKQCMMVCGLISITLATICTIFSEPLMRFAGANDDYLQDAMTYFRVIMLGIFFNAMSLTINAAQRGAGNTKISMRSNMTANIVNIILNYFLINGHWFFPKWGVFGAAVATSAGYVVAFCMSLYSVCHKSENSFLSIFSDAKWRWDKPTMGAVIKVSSGAIVEQLFMRVGFFSYAKIVAGLGTLAFATHQVCMNVMTISFGVGDGFNIASSALVGQSLG
ncbi:MAG: MATE family efflux transporter [Firmicutes bacterium]|nr:MATE family efflux transporter [Bacillota bacterium]